MTSGQFLTFAMVWQSIESLKSVTTIMIVIIGTKMATLQIKRKDDDGVDNDDVDVGIIE